MINRSLLNRIEQLEANRPEDPELLAEKTAKAVEEMIRTLPHDPQATDSEIEAARLNIIYGHHPRPQEL